MSELCLKGLERLQVRFAALAEGGKRVGSLLVEVSPEWYPFHPPPGLVMGQTPWGRGWTYQGKLCERRTGHVEEVRESRQLVDAPPPAKPFLDVDGNAIVYTSGQPIALEPGLSRYHFLYGDIEAAARLMEVAKDAGAVLKAVPFPKGQFARGAFYSRDEGLRWWYALHGLGLRRYAGTPLRTERFAYDTAPEGGARLSVRTDGPDAIASLRTFCDPGADVGIADPPTHTFTDLPDAAEASVAAVDLLLEFIRVAAEAGATGVDQGQGEAPQGTTAGAAPGGAGASAAAAASGGGGDDERAEGDHGWFHSGHDEHRGKWSDPLPLAQIAEAIGETPRATKDLLAATGLIRKRRQSWIVCVDGIKKDWRDAILKAAGERR